MSTRTITREEIAERLCQYEGLPRECLIVMQKLRGHKTMLLVWHKEGKTIRRSYLPNKVAGLFGYKEGMFLSGCRLEAV